MVWFIGRRYLRYIHPVILRRSVSTLSPLTQSFNAKPSKKFNLNLRKEQSGLFLIPELSNHEGFYLLQQRVENEIDDLVKETTSNDRKRKIVQIFDQMSDSICRVADMSDFVRVAHPDAQFAYAAEEACVKLTSIVESLNTNTEIYRALCRVIEHGDIIPTDEMDQRVGELFLFDFEQSGIHLTEDKRKKFVQLNENIMLLGTHFMKGTQSARAIYKQNLPENIRDCFSMEGDNIHVTGLYTDHYSDTVREAAYKIFLHPDKHQEDLLNNLLLSRYNLAKLVGFPTFAHRALKGTMADTPENVMNFLETLANRVKSRADKDYKDILKIKKSEAGIGKKVMPWDPPYYTALAKGRCVSLRNQDLLPYFSLGCCMEGLNNLFRCLYDVTLQYVETEPGEIWSYDVHKVAVVHKTEGVLGYIYCDFFERAGKSHQDCHYTIQGSRLKNDGSYQHPIVVLQLNFPPPQTNMPSLLSLGMVDNLFHEFGHAMHSMLGRTRYQHVTGTRCPTDFAEVPSILMEFFISDPRVLASFTRHYKTGEPLPEHIITELCHAKKMYSASDLQLQVFYSLVDQFLHGKPVVGQSTTNVLQEVQNKYYGIPYVPSTAWQLRFGHLVGYGARYYSYLMSRAVAAMIWHQCFKNDPFDREMGEKYRQEVLAHGGGKHPSELFEALLGAKPTIDKLVDSVIQEIDSDVT